MSTDALKTAMVTVSVQVGYVNVTVAGKVWDVTPNLVIVKMEENVGMRLFVIVRLVFKETTVKLIP